MKQSDITSTRAAQARLSKRIGHTGYDLLCTTSMLFLVGAVALLVVHSSHILIGVLASLSVLCILPAIWWKEYLSILPASDNTTLGRLSKDILTRLSPNTPLDPRSVWEKLYPHWQAYFFTNHLYIDGATIAPLLSSDPSDLERAMTIATALSDTYNSQIIELGYVIAGLLLTSDEVKNYLIQKESQPEDIQAIADWLGRGLSEDKSTGNKYGGIARDWAFGFTPLLDRLGHNISLSVSGKGARFDWLAQSESVKSIEKALENHANAIALIGPVGIGKTNNVYGLAQRMLEGNTAKNLKYHQIINLNATDIASRAQGPGELEQIMISLVNEAAHAGHIFLFFDDAQSFFTSAPGSIDATQILLSIIQARSVPIILAMEPKDYQNLKTNNQTLAGLMTAVVLQELPEKDCMRILEDTAAGLEQKFKILITYEALKESYRLSVRYEQDEALPGKAIKLLQQAVNHAEQSVVTKVSVQLAIEQTKGVKVTKATQTETDVLLHLEDKIHERMINQTHAVDVVSNSLRRARAGVTNPKRPIGSFLFLGPTGVGKTELAKAIAATYFNDEKNMIRLDMSEYQQPEDVSRLLSTGADNTNGLLIQLRQKPFSVVLLDEIEKAHPNVLNLLLQMLDEGQLTDLNGRAASFKDCVIIVTSNAGADIIRSRIEAGESLENFATDFTNQLISSGQFKPELLNRFDELVLFRPLTPAELNQVVRLMVAEVNTTLTSQNISVELSDDAISKIVAVGNDPRLGARPMRRTLQRAVEDTVAEMILKQQVKPGQKILIDASQLKL